MSNVLEQEFFNLCSRGALSEQNVFLCGTPGIKETSMLFSLFIVPYVVSTGQCEQSNKKGNDCNNH